MHCNDVEHAVHLGERDHVGQAVVREAAQEALVLIDQGEQSFVFLDRIVPCLF